MKIEKRLWWSVIQDLGGEHKWKKYESCSASGGKRSSQRPPPNQNPRRRIPTTIYVITPHKDEAPVPYRKALALLRLHANGKGRYIPLPECKRVLSHLFHLTKEEAYNFLDEMEQLGLVEQVPYHGIKIKRREK